MGADGGVCWVPIKNKSQADRAWALIRPFYGVLQHGNADWQQDSVDNWLVDQAWLLSTDFVYGTYGSFQDYSLESIRDALDVPDEDLCIDPSLTFAELLEDMATRPLYEQTRNVIFYLRPSQSIGWGMYDINGKRLTPIESILWEFFGWRRGVGGSHDLESEEVWGPIRDMKVLDWANELRALCDWHRVASEETWT